ncbi:hypothetical protein D3C72_1246230 [compost metagenome]
MPAHQVRQRWRRALVGHVLHLEAGFVLQHFHGDVHAASGSRGAVGNLVRRFLGRFDHFGQRLVGRSVRHQQHHRGGGHQRHRRQVLDGVIGHFHQQRNQRDVVRLADHQVIALCGRARRLGQAQCRARARLVFRHDRPAVQFVQLGAHQATDVVGAPARRGRDDDADGFAGIGFGLGRAGHGQ